MDPFEPGDLLGLELLQQGLPTDSRACHPPDVENEVVVPARGWKHVDRDAEVSLDDRGIGGCWDR